MLASGAAVLILLAPPAVADFDGDGVSDFSVLTPDGGWYIQPSSLRCCWSFSWGFPLAPGDRAVPGDYDGNRATDPAVFSPSAGTWQIMPSNGQGAYIVPFGQSGDVPVPADYDGDGRTDLAVYRDGHWYRQGGPDVAFGQPGDMPIPGDYDGDGRADPAVYRSGTWIVRRSGDGTDSTAELGRPGDRPVPADYDGDARTDPAVYRDGTWLIRRSTDGTVETRTWGQPGDMVAPGDYDGDGRTDLAVYRPAEGTWYVQGGQTLALGSAGDTPVAGAYLPPAGG